MDRGRNQAVVGIAFVATILLIKLSILAAVFDWF